MSGNETTTDPVRQLGSLPPKPTAAEPGNPRHLLTESGIGYRFQP